jgi:hypothetical protein
MKIGIAAAAALVFSQAAMAAAPETKPPGAISCIDSQHIDGQSAEGDDTILFRVGPKTYRNRLASACPMLPRLNNFGGLATEPWGGQLCKGDSVRIFDRDTVRTFGINGFPLCRLGWFEPVPPKRP